ncbi:MAG: glycoside hydrolase family 2 TIM barrel-domain containing protein [Opitutaceae bacterium]|nr:glycoside hydrolase family 2 TIM barrel-domain containing protein [Opitutaceae bacterium]
MTNPPLARLAAWCLALGLLPLHATLSAPARTLIQPQGDGFELIHEGKPFLVRGAVAPNRFELLQSCGANAVRTSARKENLDAAHNAGLMAMADLHLRGERDGFNWDDEAMVQEQTERALARVRELKDHPAVLMWVLGNELDYIPPLEPYNPRIWTRLNALARAVKEVDPSRPVLTVIGTSFLEKKVKELARDGTEFDLLGLNAYGDLAEAAQVLREHWPKPYVVSEWGPTGHWEVPKTAWKAPIEQTSSEKAAVTQDRYRSVILADPKRCLGSFVFYWSEKQETTHTWYGLFNGGLRTESIDVMEREWSGRAPANQAPRIETFTVAAAKDKTSLALKPDSEQIAVLTAADPDGDPVTYHWDIRPEVIPPRDNYAGNKETRAEPLVGLILANEGAKLSFKTPSTEGPYRLFVTVTDGKGSVGYANFPFFVSKGGTLPPATDAKLSQLAPPSDVGNPTILGKGIQRTLRLLASSTPAKRNTVRILFYGQSITEQAWTQEVERDLRQRFPHANLVTENRALGGFSSQRLVSTAESDLYSFSPDLLVFHVYGSDEEYEKIIKRVRERTTADILIQTDHVAAKEDWQNEPTDPAAITKANWHSYMNYVHLPTVIAKYHCGYVDQRSLWKRYLEQTGLSPQALLRDDVHLNELGEQLMASFAKAALVERTDTPPFDPFNCGQVRTLIAGKDFSYEGGVARIAIDGSRIDLVSNGADVPVSAALSIDGKRPSEHPELYGFTRALATPGGKWPVITRVDSAAPLLVEHWTMKVRRLDPEGKLFSFDLSGSVTGADGSGRSDAAFRSNSGRIVIAPEAWDVAYALMLPKVAVPEQFTVSWNVVPLHVDAWVPTPDQPGTESVVTIANGLPDAPHVLEIRGGEEALSAVRVYSPKRYEFR